MHARVYGNEGPHLVLHAVHPMRSGLVRHARGVTEMQITQYVLSAFPWMMHI